MEFQFESLGPTLRMVVLIFMLAFAIVGLGLLVGLAALPGRLAKSRQHPQAEAINICGWLGLPTGILWVIAMVWAYWRNTPSEATGTLSSDNFRFLGEQVAALDQAVAALESSQREVGR